MGGYIGECHEFFGGSKWNGSAYGSWPFSTEQAPWLLNYDGRSLAISAGADYIIGSQWDGILFSQFIADDSVQAFWVVEVESGSGTLQLDGGVDVDWMWNDPALANEDLGTYPVTGKTTIVTPAIAGATAGLLHDQDASIILRLRCTAGTVTINQVKFRTWGEDSPGGAWTSGSAFTMADQLGTIMGADTGFVNTGPYGSESAAWAPGKAALDAKDGTDHLFSKSLSGGGVAGQTFGTAFDVAGVTGWGSTGRFQVVELSAQPVVITRSLLLAYSPHGTAAVDPREVRQETIAAVRTPGTHAKVLSSWQSWNADVAWSAGGAPVRIAWEEIPVPDYGVPPGDTIPSTVTKALNIPADGTWENYTTAGSNLPVPDVPALAFTTVVDEYLSFIGGVGGTQISIPTPSRFTALIPAGYEWFDPSLPWVPDELAPRFFVKDLIGQWRPVGFGKPADELAVFKVPTPVGRYRDLTTAEYATYGPSTRPPDGYPLKVKRLADDGTTWWDQVGWMVPE